MPQNPASTNLDRGHHVPWQHKQCQSRFLKKNSKYGCFQKWRYPTTMGFPTKNDHFGLFWGYHHFRKPRYIRKSALQIDPKAKKGERERERDLSIFMMVSTITINGCKWVVWVGGPINILNHSRDVTSR